MPRSTLPFLLMLAACSDAPEGAEAPAAPAGASLAGLYERAGAGGTPDRACVTGEGEDARFVIVTAGTGAANCTARGRVAREGSALRLLIDGAPACTLTATADAGGLTLAEPEGAECAYYCGEGASLTPGVFAKLGSTEADARRVVDVAGESLC